MIYLPVLTGCWGMSSLFLHDNIVLIRKAETENSFTRPLSHCLWHGSSLTLQWNRNISSLFRLSGHTQHCNLLYAEQIPRWNVDWRREEEQGGRTSVGVAAASSLLGSWGMRLLDQSGAIWHSLNQSRSWQHSGTRDLQLANILMCTGMSFNQLLSQPFPVYFSVNKICSCEVSLSRFLCWQEGDGAAVSVFRAQGHRYRQTLHLPDKPSSPHRVSRPRQVQGTGLCDRDSPSFVATE